MDLQWFRVEAEAQWNFKKFQRDAGRTGVHVRDGAMKGYIGISGSEIGSMKKIAGDTNVSVQQCGQPTYEAALCGVNVITMMTHTRACNACKQLGGPRVDRHGVDRATKTLIRVEGLQSFSLDGMLSVLKEQRDIITLLSGEYDSMIKTVEGFLSVQEELAVAQQKIEEHKVAISYFLKETYDVIIEPSDLGTNGYALEPEESKESGENVSNTSS